MKNFCMVQDIYYLKNYGPTEVKFGIVYLVSQSISGSADDRIPTGSSAIAAPAKIQASRVFISIVIGAACIAASTPPLSIITFTI
jgi:hypothetical protein